MKALRTYVLMLAVLAFAVAVEAQTAEKSSGVVKLNMKKEKSRTSETSAATSIRMTKKPVRSEAISTAPSGSAGFSWASPAFTTVRTSEDSYALEATVNGEESIRFVNLFVNGQFVKNIIPPVPNIKQMALREELDLTLGPNQVRAEAVTVSGKKLESELVIIYDLSKAQYHALVIAVQEYDDPNINDLDHPIGDASKFIDVLSREYNFARENINFMKNPTKGDIIGTLHQMRSQVGPEDNLLIYYAGHGHWDEEMQTGYWLPRDAARNNPVDWIPNTDLTNYLNVLKTKHTLLIADACFSGGIFKTRGAFNEELAVEKMYKLKSRKALTSGSLTEVPDESVFVKTLIAKLRSNRDKYLPTEQLYSIMKPVILNNDRSGLDIMPRYGTIQNVGDEGGDFIFIRKE